MMPSALLVDTKSQALFLVLKVHCFFLFGWQSGISSLKWSVSISQTRTATDTQKLEDLVFVGGCELSNGYIEWLLAWTCG
ncbi:unnamed protein product [Camellia sinensis]